MIPGFFRKPHGVGSGLNIHMFSIRRLAHAWRVLLQDPTYFYNRLRVIAYSLRHPSSPWLTSDAIQFLEDHITPDMVGFEWGSGRSTKWFAKRCKHLVSIEDDETWAQRVRPDVEPLGVDYRHITTREGCDSYAGQIRGFADGYFDFIVVDGSCRNECIRAAAPKIKPGGFIVVDNADSAIDITALTHLQCKKTDNGVWRTDIYICPPLPTMRNG